MSPTTIVLTPPRGSSLTLTASNGPVTWSITKPQVGIGKLSVFPSSGTLASGQTVTIIVTIGNVLALHGQLIVNPGGITVTVLVGTGGDAVLDSSSGPGDTLSLRGRLVS